MDFKFTVTCTATFQNGKFAGRDDIASELQQSIEQADPSELEVNEGTYAIENFEVTEEQVLTPREARKLERAKQPVRDVTPAEPGRLTKHDLLMLRNALRIAEKHAKKRLKRASSNATSTVSSWAMEAGDYQRLNEHFGKVILEMGEKKSETT